MENKKPLIFLLLVAVVVPSISFAYSINTHANITESTFVEYNKLFGNFFTDKQIDLAKKGSMEEDTFGTILRPLNHFYDPINKKGLTKVRINLFNLTTGMSSPVWATDTKKQANFLKTRVIYNDKYFSSPTDFSWDRAVFEYVYGDKDRALETLGHILHLIQDATSPPHTRNDAHPIRSSYENFTKGKKPLSLNIKESDIVDYETLRDIFDNLALYTNAHFFSDDTIFRDYDSPNKNILVKYKNTTGYTFLVEKNNNKQIKIAYIKIDNTEEGSWRKVIKKQKIQYSIESPDTDYWNTLSREAVVNGVGVIKLFFTAVDEEKKTLALKNKNKSWAEIYLSKIIPKGFGIVKGLYGSSLTENNVKDLLDGGNGQVGAAVLAVKEKEPEVIKIQQEEILKKKEKIQQVTAEPIVVEKSIPVVEQPPAVVEEQVPITEELVKEVRPDFTDFLFEIPIKGVGGGGGGGGGNNTAPVSSESSDTTPPDSPTITTPSDFSQTFTSSNISFFGTAEVGSTVSTDLFATTTTADSSGDWNFNPGSFSQGTTTISFYATDTDGNKSQATTTTLFVDSNSPDILLNVNECQSSLSQNDCVTASTTLSISWNSTAGDLDYFLIDQNGAVSTTTATSTSVSVSDNSEYTFAVSAVDMVGNNSATSTQTINVSTMPIVINEVAWAGTATSSSDEWVELYNNTNSDISLDGWTLYAGDGVPYIPLSGNITAGGYYLIERTDDNTVSDIAADITVPFSGVGSGSGLSNSGENLILSYNKNNATTTSDEIPLCNNWCVYGSTNGYKTMERYDTLAPGSDWLNWGTALGEFILNGKDANGGAIYGTPKSKNSISYKIANGATLTTDKTITKSNSPYLIDRGGLTIQNGATLAIDPGVVIKFVTPNEPSLVVDGTIIANGTTNDKIVFTAFADDEYGGDMNGDGICDPDNASSTAQCPSLTIGNWQKIWIKSSSQNSSFKNTIIRYGGRWFSGSFISTRAMLLVDNSSIVFKNNVIEYFAAHGVSFVNSTTTISDNTFRNGFIDNNFYAGLYVFTGASTVSDNMFDNNNTGLEYYSEDKTISAVLNNIFTNNSYRAIYASGDNAGYYSGNSGSGNGTNAIVLSSNASVLNGTTTLQKNDLPYFINTSVNVNASSTLAIDPGVVIKFNNNGLDVYGRLDINGTVGEPVILTSSLDDSDGNDAMNDGATTGMIQSNNFVRLNSGSTSEIENAEFRYMNTALSYTSSPIYLDGVTFSNNKLGVFADTSETILKANNITWDNNTATSTIPL
jgi:hypothetical protein